MCFLFVPHSEDECCASVLFKVTLKSFSLLLFLCCDCRGFTGDFFFPGSAVHLVMNYRLLRLPAIYNRDTEKKRSKCVLFISIFAMFIFFLSLVEISTIEAYINVTILQ